MILVCILIIILDIFNIVLIKLTLNHKKKCVDVERQYKFALFFFDKVLENISIRENVDVEKYIAMTGNQIKSIYEGDENNE